MIEFDNDHKINKDIPQNLCPVHQDLCILLCTNSHCLDEQSASYLCANCILSHPTYHQPEFIPIPSLCKSSKELSSMYMPNSKAIDHLFKKIEDMFHNELLSIKSAYKLYTHGIERKHIEEYKIYDLEEKLDNAINILLESQDNTNYNYRVLRSYCEAYNEYTSILKKGMKNEVNNNINHRDDILKLFQLELKGLMNRVFFNKEETQIFNQVINYEKADHLINTKKDFSLKHDQHSIISNIPIESRHNNSILANNAQDSSKKVDEIKNEKPTLISMSGKIHSQFSQEQEQIFEPEQNINPMQSLREFKIPEMMDTEKAVIRNGNGNLEQLIKSSQHINLGVHNDIQQQIQIDTSQLNENSKEVVKAAQSYSSMESLIKKTLEMPLPTKLPSILLEDGSIYQGQWLNAKKHGYGVHIILPNTIYQGYWDSGVKHGYCEEITPDGTVYKGDYVFGQKIGKANIKYKNGEEYIGEIHEGIREGNGVYKWPDGKIYDGNWWEDQMEGIGTLQWPDGSNYKGSFERGLPNGNGHLSKPDGSEYKGGFFDGKENGIGELTYPDGKKILGEWVNGILTQTLEDDIL